MTLLVALEGIDGAGKGTQAKLLHEKLISLGLKTNLLTFPQYAQTSFGRQIGYFLDGRFGPLEAIHPVLFSVLFAGDRFESLPKVTTALEDSQIVIIDRYLTSNKAHQGARLSPEQRQEFFQWINDIETRVFGLPVPQLQILLDVPVQEAQVRIAMKSERDYTQQAADIQESNQHYLFKVREMYLQIAGLESNWHIVPCFDGNKLRDIQHIHAEVLQTVLMKFETHLN